MLTPSLILSQVQSKKIGLFLPVSRYKIYLETISMKQSPHFFLVFEYDTNSYEKKMKPSLKKGEQNATEYKAR